MMAPAWRLANLADIPAAIITAEASYHAVYDHCTAKYLTQAGVKVSAFRLGYQALHGNAQMIALEKNSLKVAAMIAGWLAPYYPGTLARFLIRGVEMTHNFQGEVIALSKVSH